MRRSAFAKVAVLFQERRSWQEHMRVVRGLVQKEVVYNDTLHRREYGHHMAGVRVGVQDFLALHIKTNEGVLDRGVEHVGDAEARPGLSLMFHAASNWSRTASPAMAGARHLVGNESMSREPCTLF